MAITISPGAILTPDQWDALFEQHGRFRPGTDPEPATVSTKPGDPAYVSRDKQQPVYRYFLTDGTTVDARTSPDGSGWEIVDYKPSPKAKEAQKQEEPAAQTPATQEAARIRDEKWWNQNTPPNPDNPRAGGSGRAETHTDRIEREAKEAKEAQAETERKEKEARAEAERNRPQVIASTASSTSRRVGYMLPDGTIKWEDNPNYNKPNPEPISAPSTVKHIVYMDADGKRVVEKNPNYKPPSKVDKDPDTGEMIEITEDADGNPLIRPVRREGTATPSPAATYPALQARAGQVSTTYTSKAQEIWARHQNGEITQKERDTALEQLTAQATSQINEINSVLSNSRAIWQDQITQRGQNINDASSRRTFASNILSQIGQVSSGMGTDKAGIGRNITALAKLGMLLGDASGGLKESPEIDMPTAVKESRDFALPGFSPPNAAGFGEAPGSMAPDEPAPALEPPMRPREEIIEEARAGGRMPEPIFRPSASVDAGPDFTTPEGRFGIPPGRQGSPPPPPPDEPAPIGRAGAPTTTTIRPDGTIEIHHANASSPVAQMGARLQQRAPMGTPVSAGGRGLFDVRGEAQSMVGEGDDPAWAAAVQEAAGSLEEDVWGRRRA
jgi:hypothetical protein